MVQRKHQSMGENVYEVMVRLLVAVIIAVVALTGGVKAASATQVRLYDVQCDKVRVEGVTTAAAPYVKVRVVTADNLMNTLAEKTEEVLPAVGRPFDITVNFLEQALGTRLVIVAGEWDGKKYINPAVPYGENCGSPSSVPPVTPPDKSFRSTDLRFTIKYPPQWTVRTEDDIVYFTADEKFGAGPEPIQYMVVASELPNPNGWSFGTLAMWGLPSDLQTNFTYTQKNIGAFTAYFTESLPSQSGALSAFLTRDGSRYIRLALNPYDAKTPFPKQAEYKSLFEAMLDTFTME